MKKYLVFALVLGMCAFLPGIANAAEEIGTNNVDQYTLGELGIGLTNPTRPLAIRVDVNNTHALSVQNAANTAECVTFTVDASGRGLVRVRDRFNVVRVQFWAGFDSFVLEKFGIGTTTPAVKLDVIGTARVKILEITGGADLSEMFRVTAAADARTAMVEPGMVVSIDIVNPGELIVSSKAYDRTVVGIVSGAGGLKTGMMMGQMATLADGDHPVALTGRVYCKVDTSQGAIAPGDLLTTSPVPGHAMKVTDYTLAQGAIIGKAMTPLAQGEKGLVLVLVSLQ